MHADIVEKAKITSQGKPEKCWLTHIIAVEGVEDSGDVAAQDADGDSGVVQRQPAAAGLLRAVATEQVVTHRTQHTQLRKVRQQGESQPYEHRDDKWANIMIFKEVS